jgi:hypothetical protein
LGLADAKLFGEAGYDQAGYDVASAGDVDDNGNDDLLLTAIGNDAGGTDAGAAYVVLGPVTGNLPLGLADAKRRGAYEDWVGRAAGAGDVDADGFDDILVAAFFNDDLDIDGGAAYLVNGPVTGSRPLGTSDARMLGEHNDTVQDVAGAGDVNADGFDDILVGSPWHDSRIADVGAIYLMLGPATGRLLLRGADATLLGETVGETVRTSAAAGDVDADGHSDILVGSPRNHAAGAGAGAAYVMLGPVSGTHSLSTADVKLVGDVRDFAGTSVACAGDMDADGRADLLIGAPSASLRAGGSAEYGAAFLVYGGSL